MAKITCTINSNFVIALCRCREVMRHDDTLPFNAELYINGIPICNTYNTGWGGSADAGRFKSDEARKLFEEKDKELRTQYVYVFYYNGVQNSFSINIYTLIDYLAYDLLCDGITNIPESRLFSIRRLRRK